MIELFSLVAEEGETRLLTPSLELERCQNFRLMPEDSTLKSNLTREAVEMTLRNFLERRATRASSRRAGIFLKENPKLIPNFFISKGFKMVRDKFGKTIFITNTRKKITYTTGTGMTGRFFGAKIETNCIFFGFSTYLEEPFIMPKTFVEIYSFAKSNKLVSSKDFIKEEEKLIPEKLEKILKEIEYML